MKNKEIGEWIANTAETEELRRMLKKEFESMAVEVPELDENRRAYLAAILKKRPEVLPSKENNSKLLLRWIDACLEVKNSKGEVLAPLADWANHVIANNEEVRKSFEPRR